MPRKPRIEVAGGIHHACNRGNNGRDLFRTVRDGRRFLADLRHVAEQRGWICLSYCLMDNHIHLLLETPKPNMGDGMRVLESRHAQAVNEREGSRGHVYQERFTSKHVDTPEYFAHVLRYIALNPVHAGLCDHPSGWRWSSHVALTEDSGGTLVAVRRVQELLADWGGPPERRYPRLFDETDRWGPWSNAIAPELPRPTIAEIVEDVGGVQTGAMRVARWTHHYRLAEIAHALGVSEATVSRRTRR